jgi:mannose-1-phosphate guanylyltransferase/mannose-6-phosphate isomerase
MEELANLIYSRKKNNTRGYTLILGAGASKASGCPCWSELCKCYCENNNITIVDDPIITFKNHIKNTKKSPREMYSIFNSYLGHKKHSIGYKHLSSLIKDGFFTNIITTNFDCLLEQALSEQIPPEDYKVLIKGELEDDKIAEIIESEIPQIRILKLNGDIPSRIFKIQDIETKQISPKLKNILSGLISNDLIIVGNQINDLNIISPLLNIEQNFNIYYVDPYPPKDNFIKLYYNEKTQYINGDFDNFFTKLNLSIKKRLTQEEEKQEKKKDFEKKLIEKREKGTSYINSSNIEFKIESFCNEIKRCFIPDEVFFITDKNNLVWREFRRRMKRHFPETNLENSVEVSGDEGIRMLNRQVRGEKPSISESANILIVDTIAFSGNTLEIAQKKFKEEWFPNSNVKLAVFTIHESLQKRIEQKNDNLHGLIYSMVHHRHEVYFPWGVMDTTSNCISTITGLDNFHEVKIIKKPWGLIELIVESEICSVRILTVENHNKYSFQRHLCRDELFMCIDQNAFLEFCCSELKENKISYDSPEIKSIIIEQGDYVLIPKGIWHRFKAGKDRIRLLEVGFGVYDENDIIRLED